MVDVWQEGIPQRGWKLVFPLQKHVDAQSLSAKTVPSCGHEHLRAALEKKITASVPKVMENETWRQSFVEDSDTS